MVKVTTNYLIRKVISKNPLQSRIKDETDEQYLKRMTHLQLQSRYIDQICPMEVCWSIIVLYLQNNLLKNIHGLDCFPNLTHLYLQRNRISKIENLKNLGKLKKIYLGYNEISVLENLEELKELTELHIEGQRLPPGETLYFDPRTIKSLGTSLRVLNVSKNNIQSISCLAGLKLLRSLIVSQNHLDDAEDVAETVSHLTLLSKLDLTYNPLTSNRKYRDSIICASKSLLSLDNKDINPNTRTFLQNLNYSKERLQASKEFKKSIDTDESLPTLHSFINPQPSFESHRHSFDGLRQSFGTIGSKLFPAYKLYVDKHFDKRTSTYKGSVFANTLSVQPSFPQHFHQGV